MASLSETGFPGETAFAESWLEYESIGVHKECMGLLLLFTRRMRHAEFLSYFWMRGLPTLGACSGGSVCDGRGDTEQEGGGHALCNNNISQQQTSRRTRWGLVRRMDDDNHSSGEETGFREGGAASGVACKNLTLLVARYSGSRAGRSKDRNVWWLLCFAVSFRSNEEGANSSSAAAERQATRFPWFCRSENRTFWMFEKWFANGGRLERNAAQRERGRDEAIQ